MVVGEPAIGDAHPAVAIPLFRRCSMQYEQCTSPLPVRPLTRLPHASYEKTKLATVDASFYRSIKPAMYAMKHINRSPRQQVSLHNYVWTVQATDPMAMFHWCLTESVDHDIGLARPDCIKVRLEDVILHLQLGPAPGRNMGRIVHAPLENRRTYIYSILILCLRVWDTREETIGSRWSPEKSIRQLTAP